MNDAQKPTKSTTGKAAGRRSPTAAEEARIRALVKKPAS
jgi:hypothetical protein